MRMSGKDRWNGRIHRGASSASSGVNKSATVSSRCWFITSSTIRRTTALFVSLALSAPGMATA
jgi:hypothetical protein